LTGRIDAQTFALNPVQALTEQWQVGGLGEKA
jgi:hypothetical protein